MIAVHMPRGVVVHVVPSPARAACGVAVHPNRAGAPVRVDITRPLGVTDAGLQLGWCGKCLGVLAVAQGRGRWLASHVIEGAPA